MRLSGNNSHHEPNRAAGIVSWVTELSEATLADPVELTRALCDIASVSGDEAAICDAVEEALVKRPHLDVRRDGNTLVARTDLELGRRVMLAGHLDTVPVNQNFPTRQEGDVLWGLGTSDMKSGTALALWIAATVERPRFDLSFAFYDCEEVESERNGLNRLSKTRPEWMVLTVQPRSSRSFSEAT
jgi:succinyl-diaminopimelate desuccinylase